MIVRPAEPTDAAAIARVHVDAWRESYRGLVPDAHLDGISYDDRTARWRELLIEREQAVFVGCEASDPAVLAFASGGADRNGDVDFEGELYAIYVLRVGQGKGVGRALVAAVASSLVARRLRSMRVWVLAKNPARKFYERLGGVLVGSTNIDIGGQSFEEVAYGFRDLESLASLV